MSFVDAIHLMRGQRDVDPVVHIAPFGMMVALFGIQRHLRHEAESSGEIGELEAPADAATALRMELPVGQ